MLRTIESTFHGPALLHSVIARQETILKPKAPCRRELVIVTLVLPVSGMDVRTYLRSAIGSPKLLKYGHSLRFCVHLGGYVMKGMSIYHVWQLNISCPGP